MSRAAILAAYLQTRSRRFADRPALLAWQDRMLTRALRRARARFPYYATVTGDRLADFPVIDKAGWLVNFAALNDRGLSLEQCLATARDAERERRFDTGLAGRSVGLSSGTSGRQAAFLTSAAERDRWAGSVLAKALPQGLLGGARVALVLRAGGPLYAAVDGGRVRFRFIDLYAPLARQVAELVDTAPTVLAAPPLLLDLLAAERRAGRLPIAPEVIYSIADVLDAEVADRIAEGFATPVGQIYQATEGFLAITCAHGRLHLNEDLLVFEAEELGRQRFTPVVTDLYRTSQAVIRYRLGDVLVAAGDPCGCGSPLRVIDGVEGRCDDLLQLPLRAGGMASCFPDLVRAAVLEASGVTDFQVAQEAPSRLRLAVHPARTWAAAADGLSRRLVGAGFVAPEMVEADFVEPAVTVKRRRISREY